MKTNYLLVVVIILMGLVAYLFFDTNKKITSFNQDKYLREIRRKTDSLVARQVLLNEKIYEFTTKTDSIYLKLKAKETEKIIIKEYYHEKIKSIDTVSVPELDSFFSKRYGLR